MSTYRQKQEALIREVEDKFKRGEPLGLSIIGKNGNLEYAQDDRSCLTSVVFVPKELTDVIEHKVLSHLKQIDPNQYYYPAQSLHLTYCNVQNIAKPATFTDADLPKVVKVLESVVSKTKSFKYSLKGIFELPTSISICAYFPEEVVPSMKLIREEIKKNWTSRQQGLCFRHCLFCKCFLCTIQYQPR